MREADAMAWLVSSGRVLASADVLDSHRARAKGLLGTGNSGSTESTGGAVVLRPCRWVHTIGMRYGLDIAYLDRSGTVVKLARVQPHRICAPVPAARSVIEAAAGSFARWGLNIGDSVEIRD